MRYNPATDRARNIDAIAAECKAAILKADRQRTIAALENALNYDAVLEFARWENDVLVAA